MAESALQPGAASVFFYRAMTMNGSTRMGFRAASDEATLSSTLQSQDLVLVGATRLPIKASSDGQSTKRVPIKDELLLHEQIATLTGRGVPLIEALEVAHEVVSAKTAPKIQLMQELVSQGASLSGAIERVGGFDPVTAGVYRAAERTGDLDASAARLATASRRLLSVRGKAITTLIYPTIIVTLGIAIVTGLLTFLVPQMADQITQTAQTELSNLPFISRVVFSTGLFMRANLALFAAIVGGLIVLAALFFPLVLAGANRVARSIPAASELLRANELARLFSVMAAMSRSGVPLAEALGTSTEVLGASRLRTQFEQLRQGLVDGGVWRDLVDRVTQLPVSTRKLLIAAERSGDLDQAFEHLAGDMAELVDTQSSRLLALLEPAVIIGLGVLVGPIILALVLAILSAQTAV